MDCSDSSRELARLRAELKFANLKMALLGQLHPESAQFFKQSTHGFRSNAPVGTESPDEGSTMQDNSSPAHFKVKIIDCIDEMMLVLNTLSSCPGLAKD